MSIIEDKDLATRLKKQQEIAHKLAEQTFMEVWNLACQAAHDICPSINGNDALTYFGTILCHFTARWIERIDKIAKLDSAGVETETIIKEIFDGILKMLNTDAIIEYEKESFPNGIKRLDDK